jgi:hypothetical protein
MTAPQEQGLAERASTVRAQLELAHCGVDERGDGRCGSPGLPLLGKVRQTPLRMSKGVILVPMLQIYGVVCGRILSRVGR